MTLSRYADVRLDGQHLDDWFASRGANLTTVEKIFDEHEGATISKQINEACAHFRLLRPMITKLAGGPTLPPPQTANFVPNQELERESLKPKVYCGIKSHDGSWMCEKAPGHAGLHGALLFRKEEDHVYWPDDRTAKERAAEQLNTLAKRNPRVDHPAHYGGPFNTYEAIKVIEAWELNFNLGNALKYIRRADAKGTPLDDLRKAIWYLDREVQRRSQPTPNAPGAKSAIEQQSLSQLPGAAGIKPTTPR